MTVIYPKALLLSEQISQPLSHARFCIQSFTVDLDETAVTVSSETADGPRDAPLRPETAEFWQPDALPATYQLDLGSARTIDYIGVVGTFGSSRAALKAETSTNALEWTQFAEERMPADDAPIVLLDDPIVARYIKLTITGAGDAPLLQVLYAGVALAMPFRVTGGFAPVNLQRRTEKYSAFTRGGQFLGQSVKRFGVEGSVRFVHLDQDWVRSDFDPFVIAAQTLPYFFTWNAEEFSEEVVFVWSEEDIRVMYMDQLPVMEVTIPMEGIGWTRNQT